MGFAAVSGTCIQCTFGMAPGVLNVLPQAKVLSGGMPAATIMDNKPFVNVPPLGMCNSLSNPTVAAATAAALGVLTPMPCVPVLSAPWTPGKPDVLIGGNPALTQDSKLFCAWGGCISIQMVPQMTVQY